MENTRKETKTQGEGLTPKKNGLYTPPRLIVLGGINEITESGPTPSVADSAWTSQ